MNSNYDVIIVGTGIAGLFCALNIEASKRVLVITKESLEKSNSYLAQGGIATLKDEDDYHTYFLDTMRAGHYENNQLAVHTMIKDSREMIEALIKFGVDFDQKDGRLNYTKEGAHSTNRILHHKDITGREITTKLLNEVKTRENIHLVPYAKLLDLITFQERCIGIVVSHEGEQVYVYSNQVVLATGGIGGLFESSTNYRHLTGDSLAIAMKHGIALENIQYIQIHPTVLYTQNQGRRFLISEAVRGEGGRLLNHKGERFVDELLPRDQVAHAILHQMLLERKSHVWLSLSHLKSEYIKGRFPNIYHKCLEEGYDLTKEPIPVTPAQHYFMGGIQVNTCGMTTMEGLYAIGETSCNGVHGANRLASNSLLESMVFARRCAERIEEEIKKIGNEVKEPHIQVRYNEKELEQEYKEVVLREIKKRDGDFYDKWCKYQASCG